MIALIFIGYTFASEANALHPVGTNVSKIDSVRLAHGIYDEFQATKDTAAPYSTLIPEWDFNTIMDALFEKNLHAGNLYYTAKQVSDILIKRRKYGEYKWITIDNIPIKTADDFSFERFDRYARGHTQYEYALVPFLNGIEGNYSSNTIKSEFEGVYIVSSDQSFGTVLDVKLSTQRNKPSSTVVAPGRRYPFVVSNGKVQYTTGTVSATFIDRDESRDFMVSDSVNFRENLGEFLFDGSVKLLKYFNGQMWLISLTDAISEAEDGHIDKISTSFSFCEVGDSENSDDLNNNGLLNIPAEMR